MSDAKAYRASKAAEPGAKGASKSLRQQMTPPERALWVAIRGKKIDGMRFRRQAPMGRYVADFYCHEARLVVEVDGRMHAGNRLEQDQERDAWMRSRGVRVLRVQARDVMRNLEGVIVMIRRIAGEPPPSREDA